MTTTTGTKLEKRGQRLYFVGSPYSAKDAIKAIGGHWDADARCWWVGQGKRAQAEQLVRQLNNGTTSASRELADKAGLTSDAPPYMVADKLREEGHSEAADQVESSMGRQKDDPSKIDVLGKAEYKGKTYYMGRTTRDGRKVRLMTLPNDKGEFIDFWADLALVQVTKRYEARERWNGRRGSASDTKWVYQTLEGIARFIRQQRSGDGPRRVRCHECDAWHNAGESCTECGGC